ncbi:MAG TPA: hypothetical protein PKA38_03780 [Candidatus Levybacteria bacterium]|nr:hypothetical protein [Candidatus Levybacteria bacterium]
MKEVRIVNQGEIGKTWFGQLANENARNWNGSVSEKFEVNAVHYPLHLEKGRRSFHDVKDYELFIPYFGIIAAGDKRIQAHLFNTHGVPTPETHLIKDTPQAVDFLRHNPDKEWILKYPTGLATRGHTIVNSERMEKLDTEGYFTQLDWQKPFIVQEFVRHENPEVYRTYCVDGEVFAWNVRKFPDGVKPKDLVAHAVGARYFPLENPTDEAIDVSKKALEAVQLLNSFGVVDLIKSKDGKLLVLEVGTDGIDTIVDRDFDNSTLTQELNLRIRDALHKKSLAAK